MDLTVEECKWLQSALTALQQRLGGSSWLASCRTPEEHERAYAMKTARDAEVSALKARVIDEKRRMKAGGER